MLFAACCGRAAAKVHAGKDEDGAEEEPGGDLLVEQPPGKDDGGDGVEIDPVGGDDGSQLADDPVPEQETDHRGNDAQKQDVPDDGLAENDVERGEPRHEAIVGNDGQQPVEEQLTRNK